MKMTNRQRMLAAIKGEMPDALPFAPRLDLWYAAAQARNTLPVQYQNDTLEDICRKENWGIYRLTGDYRYLETTYDDWPFCCLGIYAPPETVYAMTFDKHINVKSRVTEGVMDLIFETPKGDLTTTLVLNNDMKKEGVTYPWIKEKLIKTEGDWDLMALLFESLTLIPRYDSFLEQERLIGESGLIVSQATDPGSPVHLIQKNLIDPTTFFTLYKQNRKKIDKLADSVSHYFNQVLDIYEHYPGEVLAWGCNYDRTITFPPYFETDILPWHIKVHDRLKSRGKYILTHTDGENDGLLDLILQTKVDGCESLCPYPMTRIKLHEYRKAWKNVTIIGGIPADYLIPDKTTETQMIDYLDYSFKAMAPGTRFIPGITDGVSPLSTFERLQKMGTYFAENGGLPLDGQNFKDIFTDAGTKPVKGQALSEEHGILKQIQQCIIEADKLQIKDLIHTALENKLDAGIILEQGMIAAMNYVGDGFAEGKFFIPEMLLAAQTMEEGVRVLKPHLLEGSCAKGTGKILLGTVSGDLHDIGKNLVAIMLRGVGFEVIDLGINVAPETFIAAIQEHCADILALSALLTTTMPKMKQTIDAVVEAGLREKIKIMVGGAPVTREFAAKIGADGYAETAGSASRKAQELMGV